jgi:Tol biopolymer transport system component/C-terminal processing protease CtpA/Prc
MRTLALALCLSAYAFLSAPAQSSLPSLSDPAISPDGHEIAFVSGGDIWTVPASGGEARLLVTHPATESRPLYSPDGKRLAFVSTRTGGGNIYILTLATGDLQRLTWSEGTDKLDAWSADSNWIYFTSTVNDVAGQGDIFRVKSAGGTPLEVSKERYLNEFESAPSPDGSQIALVARGISATQWWRNGHAHIDETEIWLKPIASTGAYKKLISADAKHAWPMWSADGKTLYFMSDKSGAENIWAASASNPDQAKPLTTFKEGRVLWPSIGAAGKTIVFERDFAVWSMSTASGKAERVPIQLRGSGDTPGITHLTESTFRTLALSPDGKKIAILARGKLFAAPATSGGDATPVPSDAVAVLNPKWSPDSNSILYIAERANGDHQLELYNFTNQKSRTLTTNSGYVEAPVWSPNGKSIAYVLNEHDLHLLTVPGSPTSAVADKVLTHGELGGTIAWSPDNQWIAFTLGDARSFTNLHVIPAAGGTAQPITFLANGNTARTIAWSPDGKYILFNTAQRSEEVQLARVDLLPNVPRFREDEFRELFRPTRQPGTPEPNTPTTPNTSPDSPINPNPETPAPEPAAPASAPGAAGRRGAAAGPATPPKPVEPVKIVFEGIRNRLSMLPLGISSNTPVISPDGKTLVFSATAANQQQLYTWSLDDLAREPASARQLTSTPGRKSDYAFAPDGRSLFYLENGGVRILPIETRIPRPLAVTARLQVNFDEEKKVVFQEAWETLNRQYADPAFNGHDWKKLHDQWEPYIAGARTGDELRADINLLIGELNSSHSGINRPMAAPGAREEGGPTRVGNLGLRFDREKYEAGQGLIVTEVVNLGPAFIEGSIKPGDKLVSVNGSPIANRDLAQLLEDSVGRRTVLGVETAGKSREAVVRPIANAAATGLLYRQWVEANRAYVDKISGGKIGYVHIAAMGDPDLQQLYLDLDAANESKQAVIVDVRNNNGGYVNGYVLDVFTRRNYLEMTSRISGTPVPSRQALGQRALGLPTVLVTNESTLSDGEDFTEGYRALKLGKVVGEPTAGWIIFTGAQQLIDGSSVRTPGTKIFDLRGQNMELHPRPVDVEVQRPLGETELGTDSQLQKAVEVLLQKQ